MTRPGWLLWAALTALLALSFRAIVEGDGVGYYSYLHTLLYDHDLDFSDEYRAALDAGVPVWADWITRRSATGLLVNFYPVGTALLSTPAYLAALALHPDGRPLFGPPFTTAYVAASLFWGLLALALSYRLAGELLGARWPALVGAAVAGLATPLTYYLLLEPSYSHSFSAFAAAAFVYAWWRGGWRNSAPKAFGLGLLIALTALVRYQDGLLGAIVLLDARRARWRLLATTLGTAVGFAPQLGVDQVLFGSWLPNRPPELAFEPWPGHYLQLLLASQHGLFLWCPAMLLALVGAALLPDRRLALAFLIGFLGQVAVQGAAPDWSAGHSFGPRRFAVLTVFVAVGTAVLAQRVGRRPALAALAALAVWNLVLIANFVYLIRVDVDPGYAGLGAGQLRALPYVPRFFVQGEVFRALVAWPALHRPFDPLLGVSLLLLEAAAAAFALRVATLRFGSHHV